MFRLLLCVPLAASTTYTNPLIPLADTPDPGVAFSNGSYWAATTTGGAPCFALHRSADLATWEAAGHMFSSAPAWADAQNPSCWAPELHYINATRSWVAFYVARAAASGLLSVGGATSSGGPGGPWTDLGAPLVEDAGAGAQGQIDPTLAWRADGAPVLVWKEDGNADGRPTPIHFAELAPSATQLVDPGKRAWKATALIADGLDWEHGIVEAPWVVPHGGEVFLFYSGSGYTSGYAVGVARAPALEGPFVKRGPPILHQNGTSSSTPPFESPGHCSVLQLADGKWAMLYHAWRGGDRSARHLMMDQLLWGADGWPFLQGGVPTTEARPVP